MTTREQFARRELLEQNPELLRKVEGLPLEWDGSESSERGKPASDSTAGLTALTAQPIKTNWPDPLSPEALYGLAGDVVRAITPHSESDAAALLLQFLVGFGSVVGRQPHFVAEADRHPCNLYSVIVGQTSKGRKGTSLGQIQRI